MQRFKKIILVALVMMLCGGGMISAASAEMVKKIVLFHESVTQEERSQYAQERELQGVSALMDLPFINGLVLSVPDTISSAELADDCRVASVEEDQQVELQAIEATGEGGAGEGGAGEGGATSFITPTDPVPNGDRPWSTLNLYSYAYDPWLLTDRYVSSEAIPMVKEAINALNIHNIKVAIFDTGVDRRHRDLRRKIAGGVDLVNMTDGVPKDDNGHGTHVAGTLCGRDLGILPYKPVRLYAVKVLDQYAMGDISTLIMGLQWAIDNGIHIVNMSIAFREDNPVVHLAIRKAFEAGIVMVAAVGNHSNWLDDGATGEGGAGEGGAGEGGAADTGTVSNPYPVMYPAAYPEVIAVGAMDSFEDLSPYSNTGQELDVLAPGTNIISTDMGGGYGLCSGTSMASPHVTGVAAIMLAVAKDLNKSLAPGDVQSILKQTALQGKINLVGALEDVLFVVP